MNEPETLAAQNGFSHWAQLNMAAAVPLEAVRDMCADGRCGRYGHNWACPPGCGSIEAAARRIAGFDAGILVQTTGALRDDFDYESEAASQRMVTLLEPVMIIILALIVLCVMLAVLLPIYQMYQNPTSLK